MGPRCREADAFLLPRYFTSTFVPIGILRHDPLVCQNRHMKLKITAVLTPILGLALLFFAYGILNRVHAKSPHKCMRPGALHAQSHTCGHSDDPQFQHGLGEKSEWQQEHGGGDHGLGFGAIQQHDPKADRASMDFTDPCICPIRCFFNGAMNHVPLKDWINYGLLHRG
jgi:hypothetical protein